ncbi:RHS repeat domain-containing protein [Flavobacterium litorale]|uniref:RHS repeat-associated core domain-containing protein n=1 Tax=Flavobacterium litorale TaxID=2856519 RepID=A0ABX8V5X1_9FLAO|nr:RHS repeat-associated core domain-containing protein [Flavobacterium litorale]QYJ68239.1 RHS repeat-associated core domain-containing protein [Flavobacterium litorale]
MEYLPFGETLVDEHNNSHNTPFKFNGKEFDEETGNYYYSARYYDPKMSIFISVDPLVEKTMDSYGYTYNNPINLVDPTGMSADLLPTDYYNIYGKHVKHVDDGSNAKKMVLTSEKGGQKVDEAISKGHVMNQFSDSNIENMDEIYKFGKKDKTGAEKGFIMGQEGESSVVVTSEEAGKLDDEWKIAIKDLQDRGIVPSSDVHLHPLEYENGQVKRFGKPIGSPEDIKPKNNKGFTQPSIVLGWKEIQTPLPFGEKGGVLKNDHVPKIGFFTSNLDEIITVDYRTFKKGVKKMNKHKPKK